MHLGEQLTTKVISNLYFVIVHTLMFCSYFQIMTEVLRAVYALPNVRRAPNKSGELKRCVAYLLNVVWANYGTRFKEESRLELRFAYIDQNQAISAWPISLTIQVCCFDLSQVKTMIDITIVWCIEISNIDGHHVSLRTLYLPIVQTYAIYDHDEFTCLLTRVQHFIL